MISPRALVFDIDNTAVPNGAERVESQELIDAFASMPGWVYSIAATGRAPDFALPITRDLGLQHDSIVANGALIIDSQTGEARYQRLLSVDATDEIIRIAFDYQYRLWFDGDPKNQVEFARDKEPRATAGAFINTISPEDAVALNAAINQIEGVRAYLSPAWEQQGAFDLNIGNELATKGNALRWLLEKYGLEPIEVVGVGDGKNDIELFEVSGIKVAVEDADPVLLAEADTIIPSVDKNGLIEVIRYFFN